MAASESNKPVALITGASRGIGLAVATELYQRGYALALCARSIEQATKDSSLLNSLSGNDSVLIKDLDVSDETAVRQFVSETIERFGRIDVLVNNAGINHQGTWDLPTDEFREQLGINTIGPFLLAKSVIPQMLKQQRGYIFNIGSICSFIGFPTVGSYTASKFALRGWNESLFRELGPKGIRVTLIGPSWVDTQMAEHAPMPPEKRIQPQDIASTITHLLSLSQGAVVRELVIECVSDLS